jgi:hypothetical protein
VEWIGKQVWADVNNMLMLGQSAGGLATLAYATRLHPGIKLYINFAGGLISRGSCDWRRELRSKMAQLGRDSGNARSIWFYGSNDSFFPVDVYRSNFEAYAKLVENGIFAIDSHTMFTSFDGIPLWLDIVLDEMNTAGLPTKEVNSKYGRPPDMPRLPATGFASVEDATTIPYISESARRAYSTFLTMRKPKAYAISPDGAWAWAEQGNDPLFRALAACNAQNLVENCKLYAIDDDVVWIDK